jgi:succinate-acetate transporter protein
MLSTCTHCAALVLELLLLVLEILFIQILLACVTERSNVCVNKHIGFCFDFEHFH